MQPAHGDSVGLQGAGVVGSKAAAEAVDSYEDQLVVVETEAEVDVKRSVRVVAAVFGLAEGMSR